MWYRGACREGCALRGADACGLGAANRSRRQQAPTQRTSRAATSRRRYGDVLSRTEMRASAPPSPLACRALGMRFAVLTRCGQVEGEEEEAMKALEQASPPGMRAVRTRWF
eukprot:2579191-Rhodomonas_salina.1